MNKNLPKEFHPRYVFFDLDGTLISHTLGKVPESARLAIRLLQEKGILCATATGRHLREMEELPGNDIPFDAYVMMNGQMIYNADRVLIDGLSFKGESEELILNLFHEKKLPIELMGENRIYMNFVNDYVVSVLADVSTIPPEPMDYKGDKIFMAVCFGEEKEENLLKASLPDCRITRWHPGGMDIIDKNGGKAQGIRRLLARESIDTSEIIVFGDSENDMDMLSMAGLGIAMGNGTKEAKDAADYITTSTDKDGIYRALEHFHVI